MRAGIAVVVLATVLAACARPVDDYVPPPPTGVVETRPLGDLLRDPTVPVDIALVGDGTGASLGGWVFLTMHALSQRFGRPAVIHDWDYDAGRGYREPPIRVADGTGEPIELWNASVSRNVEFLRSALDGMQPPDGVRLVLVNNGLDMGAGTLARESVALVRSLSERHPRATVAVILQPSPPGEDEVTANVRDLAVSARINDIPTVDVAPAFSRRTGLYDAGERYADLDGQRVWSSVVAAVLGDGIVVPR